MDRRELVTTLRRRLVPDSDYWVEGVHENPTRDEAIRVERDEHGWRVAITERGERRVMQQFEDEAMACGYAYHQLTGSTAPSATTSLLGRLLKR